MSKNMTQAGGGNSPVILQYLQKYKGQIAAALPRHLTADRMARIVTTEIRKVPQLANCNPQSLFGAVIQASQLGLEPGSALGHCYLIPFKQDVTLIIGYRGMIDLARRSGQIRSIEARAVYEQDEFKYSFGLNPDLQHVPSQDANRGEITHVYAVAHLMGGGVQWDVMTVAEVNAIRDSSDGYKAFKANKIRTNPWHSHWEEMAKKTVLRKLFKYLPVSIEMQQAVGLDEQGDVSSQKNAAVIDGEFMQIGDEDGDAAETQPATATASAKAKLSQQAQQPPGMTLDEYAKAVSVATTDEDAFTLLEQAKGHLDAESLKDLEIVVSNKVDELTAA